MVQKPTIYLYGKDQVPLPKLPDWDKEKYPCAVIVVDSDEDIKLYVSDSMSRYGPSFSLYDLHFGATYKKWSLCGTKFVEVENDSYETIYRIIWTNNNIYNCDFWGAITEGVAFSKDDNPVLDETDRPYVLCNGTLLPALPELSFDNAVIHCDTTGAINLHDSAYSYVLQEQKDDGTYGFANSTTSTDSVIERQYTCTGAGWMRRSSHEGFNGIDYFDGEIIWSNHDIIDVNGTAGEVGSIYFPKSADPVPFEPEPQLNPTALMQGYVVGQAIRRNRK